MKTRVLRLLCAVLAFCFLVCAFAACGSDKKETTSETASVTSKAGGEETPDVTSAVNRPSIEQGSIYADPNWDPYASIPDSVKGSTVRFATWIDHTATEGAVPLANFFDDTGLKVELFTVAQNGYVDKLMTSIASGDIPDVFVSNEGNQNFPLTMQIAAPIDLVSHVDLKDPLFDQTMLETGKIGSHYYLLNTIGTPWSGGNLCYFNKALFEENGFKTPAEYYEEGNWTWETMKKVMKDVKSLGSDYIGGYVDPEIIGDSAGASFCMYDYKTNKFTSGCEKDALVEAYQYYAELKEEGLTGGGTAAFCQGKCGIVLIGVYGLKNTGYYKDMNPEDVGFTYLPARKKGEIGLGSSIYRMYGIVEGAPNADAGGYFIRYWLDPDNYDLNNTFLTPEAGIFYYSLINKTADQKYFNYDDATCTLIGEANSNVFKAGAAGASSAQVPTKIAEVANVVEDACAAANAIIQSKIDTYH